MHLTTALTLLLLASLFIARSLLRFISHNEFPWNLFVLFTGLVIYVLIFLASEIYLYRKKKQQRKLTPTFFVTYILCLIGAYGICAAMVMSLSATEAKPLVDNLPKAWFYAYWMPILVFINYQSVYIGCYALVRLLLFNELPYKGDNSFIEFIKAITGQINKTAYLVIPVLLALNIYIVNLGYQNYTTGQSQTTAKSANRPDEIKELALKSNDLSLCFTINSLNFEQAYKLQQNCAKDVIYEFLLRADKNASNDIALYEQCPKDENYNFCRSLVLYYLQPYLNRQFNQIVQKQRYRYNYKSQIDEVNIQRKGTIENKYFWTLIAQLDLKSYKPTNDYRYPEHLSHLPKYDHQARYMKIPSEFKLKQERLKQALEPLTSVTEVKNFNTGTVNEQALPFTLIRVDIAKLLENNQDLQQIGIQLEEVFTSISSYPEGSKITVCDYKEPITQSQIARVHENYPSQCIDGKLLPLRKRPKINSYINN